MALIADPMIGGTYMTLLATFSNLGGTWPRFFVLEAVDYFTEAVCYNESNPEDLVNCITDEEKANCKSNGGTCIVNQDGYFFVSNVCVSVGFFLLVVFILPQIKHLQCKFKFLFYLFRAFYLTNINQHLACFLYSIAAKSMEGF